MSAAQSFRLQHLDRIAAERARVWALPRTALGVPGTPFRLALREPNGRGCGPEPMRVALRWGDEVVMLRCPVALVYEALRALDLKTALNALPADLAALLVEAALTPAIEAWECASGHGVAVLGVEPGSSELPAEGLHFLLSAGAHSWALHLTCAAEAVAELLAPWPVAPRGMNRLGLPASLRVGVTRLPRRVLASLHSGDAILLQAQAPNSVAASDAVLVLAESWTAAARRDESGAWVMIEAPLPALRHGRGEWTMDGNERRPAAPVADPDSIPVTLAFEVGRLEVPLGDLRRMGPGFILELGRGAGELVEIAAHGRPIGRGELVEVDGTVAVRIVRLFDYE